MLKRNAPIFLDKNLVHHLYFQFQFIRPIDWVMLNVWNWIVCTMLIWIFTKLYLIVTSVLLLKAFVVNELWRTADSNGWRASSAPHTYCLILCHSVWWQNIICKCDLSTCKPHQKNLRAMCICVSGAMATWPNKATTAGAHVCNLKGKMCVRERGGAHMRTWDGLSSLT